MIHKFLGVPLEIEPWFEDHWSWCKKPTKAEQEDFRLHGGEVAERMKDARFEAICRIDADGKEKLRGLLFSIPKA